MVHRGSPVVVLLAVLLFAGCAPAAAPGPTAAPKLAAATEATKPAPTTAPPKPAAATAPPKPAATAPAAAKPAASPAAKAETSAEAQRLIAAAKAAGENQLDLSWADSPNAVGGSAAAKKLEELFNRMYGMNIRVNFTPGIGFSEAVAKITQEVRAGRKTYTDIFLVSDNFFAGQLDEGIAEEYDYTRLSPRITRDIVTPKSNAIEVASRTAGITYNTRLVPTAEVPRKLEDVLNPKWKGKIASTPNAQGFDRVAYRPEWGPDKLKAFMTRFAGQVGGLIRVSEQSRLASGEFAMLVLNAGNTDVKQLKARGAPLEHFIPEDAGILNFSYLGIPRTSAHPNVAKLYLNAMMSEEGQRILYETMGTDHYALSGAQSAAELSELRAKGIDLLRFNVKFVAEHPEANQLANELEKILRAGSGN